MAKNNYKFSKTRKSLIAALCALTVTCTGLAAACSNDGDGDDSSSSSFKREDTVQLLKNGTFESYSIPKDAVYLIKNVDSWSRGGDNSNAMSGIIGTSQKNWAALTDEGLSDKLDYNNDLNANDEDYADKHVDYNGMKTRDIPYKDTYSALLEAKDVQDSYIKNQSYKTYFGIVDEGDKSYLGGKEVKRNPDDENDIEYYFVNQDGTLGKSVRYALIDNPETHYAVDKDENGLFFLDGGERVAVYEDKDSGDYFYYADGNAENDTDDNKVFISNVLMVHNYPTDSKYNGIQQYYSSQSITLEANTAAEISLWVKTSDLKFDKGYSQLNDQDRGAFIEVTQTVNGSSVSSFKIKAINTEKIIADGKNGDITLDSSVVSNGWIQYTVYVNACDFGNSNITINLGLGQNAKNSNDYSEKCTGYAFFDDVTVTKYLSLDDENCSYTKNAAKLTDTTCTLTTDAEDKIFIADRALSNRNVPADGDRKRNSEDFFYLVDLASENGDITDKYSAVNFTGSNTTVGFTTEKDKTTGITYASSNTAPITVTGVANGFNGANGYKLPDGLKKGLDTSQDIIGAYSVDDDFTFSSYWSSLLNKDLLGDNGLKGLPKYDETGTSMLVMLSAGGAAYTATVTDNKFAVKAGEYMIVSFWVKTSDMDGKTAATVKITNGDKDSEKTITLDSTGVKTDFDKDNKDIYNGWVQCFFFVENDTEQDETFHLEFSFGNTEIIDTTVNSYAYGWAALANVQVLSFDKEDIYSLTSSGDYSQQFSFTAEDDDEEWTGFDTVSGTSNIKNGIAAPANYDGVNGGSSAVSKNPYKEGYDEKNTNDLAGLINRDEPNSYSNTNLLTIFNAANWSAAFEKDGNYCYQPLVIINTIRAYAENASANEYTYADYYVETTSGTAGAIKASDDKYYVKATSYDPDETYYSLGANYGFVGTSNSIGNNSYQTVSVKVMVSANAVAYVYLVDSNSRDVLSYTTPKYTFYYDDEGNVLDEKFDEEWTDSQHKNHVVYTLLDNGLYKDKDGNIRANLYNLTKAYKSYYEFQHNVFYTDASGAEESLISFDKLVDGETYYTAEGKQADHYLVNSDGKRVYKFVDGEYFYIVDGKVSSQTVDYFEEKYAIPDAEINEDYFVEVGPTDGKWVTVNFVIHTGSEAKDYRLELWSGMRGETGDLTVAPQGAVAFDYNGDFDINDEDGFNKVRTQFENEIIREYKALLKDHPEVLANENIEYYEKEAAKLDDIDQTKLAALQAKYKAHYYSYTLYDDPSYIPFNAETAADGETGYDYKITDEEYGERLAVLKYEDETSYNVLIDYSAVDQSVEIDKVSDDDDDEGETPETDWLIITSIILVVALLFALVSIVVRDLVKKLRKKQSVKAQSKNMYRKRERYIKKLHLVKNEPESGETEETEE